MGEKGRVDENEKRPAVNRSLPGKAEGQEPEQEYTLYFYDGRVRRHFGKLSQFQVLPVFRIAPARLCHFSISHHRLQEEVVRIAKTVT